MTEAVGNMDQDQQGNGNGSPDPSAADIASSWPATELVALFREIRTASEAAGVSVRALGGVGVYLRAGAPSEALTREYADLDVAAPSGTRADVQAVMNAAGLHSEERFNALQGGRRQIWWTRNGTAHVDVFLGEFTMCHRLKFQVNLDIDHDALPAADLLLTKLQVVELNHKDAVDAAALLLTHELGSNEKAGVIDQRRLVDVLTDDWGFFTTASDNLSKLPAMFADTDPHVADQVAEAATQIRTLIDEAPKSRRFRLRGKVGRRVPWYQLPDGSM